MKFFCGKCMYHHDQLYANHTKYGRKETNKWPLTKAVEDLLLKCDVHKNEKLKMFCQDHSQLCCSDCAFLNHRQCANVARIFDSVKNMSVDMQQLSINLQKILDELYKLKSTPESSIQCVEISFGKKLQEIQDLRKKLNAALDALENTTLKELDEIRTTLLASLKKDVDDCSRLKDELKQLSEAVNDLCDKSNKEIEFIASRKCLDKIQESELYLKKQHVKMQSPFIFKANSDIEKYLYQQASLGRIEESMKSLTLKMNSDQVFNVKSKSEFILKIKSDASSTCSINGICCLPCGEIIVTDYNNRNVKLLDKHFNVINNCDVPGNPNDICQITSSQVAVTLNKDVQFISVTSGQLVKGMQFQLTHFAYGIAFHQGALYITSGTALYQYTLSGSLVKNLYEDAGGSWTVWRCAVSPAGDKIYVTNSGHSKLITLATDGTLISTFSDPEMLNPYGVHVTLAGQVLVCGRSCQTVIQVDHAGRKKLATLVSQKDGGSNTLSAWYNTNFHQLIVGLEYNNTIYVMELH